VAPAAVVLLIALFPVYFMTITAFHRRRLPPRGRRPFLDAVDLQSVPRSDPPVPYMTWMRNTVLVSVCSTILSVSFATFAAYSLSRLRYPGRQVFANAVFLVYLFPSTSSSSRSLSSAKTSICWINCPR
jgi:ABC-type maltose transport system permease subunit